MGYTAKVLDEVLGQLHPGDAVITMARARRDEVLAIAAKYEGCLRTYGSGSIAHRTANFDTDADCGMVLDRRTYPKLGPDGEGVGSTEIVKKVCSFLRDEMKPKHPNIRFRITKRAIQVTYNEPLPDGTDPQVDLIVALTRKQDDPGLWIPNTEKDGWDASHPERHTELLTAEPKALRQKRARVIRLAKGENGEHNEKALCSFNLEALALPSVDEGSGLGEALAAFFEHGAADLDERRTPDPADVSPPIKTLLDRRTAAKRLGRAGEHVREALAHDDDEAAVRAALSKVFPSYVSEAVSDRAMRSALAAGGQQFTTAGFLARPAERERMRTTRAFGDGVAGVLVAGVVVIGIAAIAAMLGRGNAS